MKRGEKLPGVSWWIVALICLLLLLFPAAVLWLWRKLREFFDGFAARAAERNDQLDATNDPLAALVAPAGWLDNDPTTAPAVATTTQGIWNGGLGAGSDVAAMIEGAPSLLAVVGGGAVAIPDTFTGFYGVRVGEPYPAPSPTTPTRLSPFAKLATGSARSGV